MHGPPHMHAPPRMHSHHACMEGSMPIVSLMCGTISLTQPPCTHVHTAMQPPTAAEGGRGGSGRRSGGAGRGFGSSG
eukprot:scaffold275693_cov21-Tisochrysis_lutea.AAC.2